MKNEISSSKFEAYNKANIKTEMFRKGSLVSRVESVCSKLDSRIILGSTLLALVGIAELHNVGTNPAVIIAVACSCVVGIPIVTRCIYAANVAYIHHYSKKKSLQ